MYTEMALAALISIGLAAAAPAGRDDQFVKQLYSDVLDHHASRADLTKWTTFLENGGTRIQIASALTSSQEYRTLLVQDVYKNYLNRVAATGEVSFWLAWHGITVIVRQVGIHQHLHIRERETRGAAPAAKFQKTQVELNVKTSNPRARGVVRRHRRKSGVGRMIGGC